MWLDTPIKGGSLPPKTLSLTFDDGPGPCTLDVAQYLAEENIQATFFVVGKHVQQHPQDVFELRKLGHIVGNHSFSHIHLTDSYLSAEEVISEVKRQPEGLFFRPPYGSWTPRLSYLLRSREADSSTNIGPVNWDIGGFDFKYWMTGKPPEACAGAYRRSIEKRSGKNGIVLFHDHSADVVFPHGGNQVLQLMRILIPQLRDGGYKIATLEAVPLIQNILQEQDDTRRAGAPSASSPARPPGTP